jgi:hypothetical protein
MSTLPYQLLSGQAITGGDGGQLMGQLRLWDGKTSVSLEYCDYITGGVY